MKDYVSSPKIDSTFLCRKYTNRYYYKTISWIWLDTTPVDISNKNNLPMIEVLSIDRSDLFTTLSEYKKELVELAEVETSSVSL